MQACVRFHRDFHQSDKFQRDGVWKKLPSRRAKDCLVGILGLGEIGSNAANKIAAKGFGRRRLEPLAAHAAGIQTVSMARSPGTFQRTHILVCLLPLTPRHRRHYQRPHGPAALPRGALCDQRRARARRVVDADLIAARLPGLIDGALLDVFTPEPPAAGSSVWKHPKISLTPHVCEPDPAGHRAAHDSRQHQAPAKAARSAGLVDPGRRILMFPCKATDAGVVNSDSSGLTRGPILAATRLPTMDPRSSLRVPETHSRQRCPGGWCTLN